MDSLGSSQKVQVETGKSLMQGAVENNVDGIIGECGGNCICATCHCYIDEAWADKVGPPTDMEESMLECVEDLKPRSRLGCQVLLRDELDGLIIHLPASQG